VGKKFIFKVLNSMDSKKTGHVEAEHEVMFILSEGNHIFLSDFQLKFCNLLVMKLLLNREKWGNVPRTSTKLTGKNICRHYCSIQTRSCRR